MQCSARFAKVTASSTRRVGLGFRLEPVALEVLCSPARTALASSQLVCKTQTRLYNRATTRSTTLLAAQASLRSHTCPAALLPLHTLVAIRAVTLVLLMYTAERHCSSAATDRSVQPRASTVPVGASVDEAV